MTEQELRAWSLAIAVLLQKEKSVDFPKLIEAAIVIGEYINTGAIPPKKEKDISALYSW